MSAPQVIITMERYQELIDLEKKFNSGKVVEADPDRDPGELRIRHYEVWQSRPSREIEYVGRDNALLIMNSRFTELSEKTRLLEAKLLDKDADNMRVKLFEEGSLWFRLKCAFMRYI
jgi:hypothetical protein